MDATIWTAEKIREKLASGDRGWLVHSLQTLYDQQTADEKMSEETSHRNSVGFSGHDAEILSSFAKQWRAKRWLSEKQYAILQKKLPKYSGQLERLATERKEEESKRSAVKKVIEPLIEKTIAMDISESECDSEGFVTFPDGKKLRLDDINEESKDADGDVAYWFTHIDGIKYILFND